MINRTTCCIALALLSSQHPACAQRAESHGTDPTLAAWHADLMRVYSGQRAKDIVADLEQYWRLTGNNGFNAGLERVVAALEEVGYQPEHEADAATLLTYRMERRPLDRPVWEPVDATLDITPAGERRPLLRFATNRSMIAINSHPTTEIDAEVVYVGSGSPERFDGVDVAGKIVFGETSVGRLFREAVQQRGAIGVLAYRIPSFNRPDQHPHAIQFSSIPFDAEAQSWGVLLSFSAREQLLAALEQGRVYASVSIETNIYEAEELTLVANVRGSTAPDERFVFSAHVNEPGANDNGSGVAALAEAARTLAALVKDRRLSPARTITMLWGSEIRSTARYLSEDSVRARGVRWGMSLDMVGEDTEKTGGTFLIERMPDPSAVWTRGEDKHTEWGSRPLTVDDLTPHYFNDLVLNRCREQASVTGWVVRTNPYEGGSDHVPFLRAGKPGLLLWHFTDVFYHTDLDRIQNVSAETLANVGVCALLSAVTLTSADGTTTRFLIDELKRAALSRLAAEYDLSRAAIADGNDRTEQTAIVRTWMEWYRDAIRAAQDIEVGGSSPDTRAAIDAAVNEVVTQGEAYLSQLQEL